LSANSIHGPASRMPGFVGSGPSMQLVQGEVAGASGAANSSERRVLG
jgi:hypothetical protein